MPLKQVDQQDILSIHRVRERLVKQRTALSNQARGLLLEYGITVPLGIANVRKKLPEVTDLNYDKLTPMAKELFSGLYDELCDIEIKIKQQEKRLQAIYDLDYRCQLIGTINGVGLMTATAMIASIGDGKEFEDGRQLSAWLGLVPRQHSTGGKDRLFGISKRGDKYLRSLLVHGARSELWASKRKSHQETRFTRWAKHLEERRGTNKAIVAMANKKARAIWAMLNTGEVYRVETV